MNAQFSVLLGILVGRGDDSAMDVERLDEFSVNPNCDELLKLTEAEMPYRPSTTAVK